MALSAGQEGTTTNRILNQLQYGIANVADDITTGASGDKLLFVDVSDGYKIKYGDADNIQEVLAGTTQMSKGAGVSSMESYAVSITRNGGLIHTRIVVDLTGLATSTTDLDIIGNPAGATSAHLGQVTVAQNGTLIGGQMTCLELPTTGADDIDLYSATVSTGAQDGAVQSLTESTLITAGGAWANGDTKGLILLPPANDYLYLVNGEGGTVGTYASGKFLIELFGV